MNTSEHNWPRVGARFEDGLVVVRPLEDGEASSLPRAVRIAEPDDTKPSSLVAAMREAAVNLAASIRAEALQPVTVVVRVPS